MALRRLWSLPHKAQTSTFIRNEDVSRIESGWFPYGLCA